MLLFKLLNKELERRTKLLTDSDWIIMRRFLLIMMQTINRTFIKTGMVVATIIPQHENEHMIGEGLTILKQCNPGWLPQYTVTDKSTAELNAFRKVFPSTFDFSVISTEHKPGRDGCPKVPMMYYHGIENLCPQITCYLVLLLKNAAYSRKHSM